VRRVALQFLSEPHHVVVHRARARVVLVPPDFIEEFVPRDRALSVLGQELECLEFLCGDFDLLASTGDFGLEKIHCHVLKNVHVFRADARCTSD